MAGLGNQSTDKRKMESRAVPSFDSKNADSSQFSQPKSQEFIPTPQIETPPLQEFQTFQAPEVPPSFETHQEQPSFAQEKESGLDKAIDSLKRKLRKPKKQKPTAIPQIRDEVTLQIEKIMEDGLKDAYQALTPVQKQEFKIKGEQVAFHIRQLMKHTHIKIKQVFKLIFEWLRLLPGINRFYLEQEAKIKTDKIVQLHRQRRGK